MSKEVDEFLKKWRQKKARLRKRIEDKKSSGQQPKAAPDDSQKPEKTG